MKYAIQDKTSVYEGETFERVYQLNSCNAYVRVYTKLQPDYVTCNNPAYEKIYELISYCTPVCRIYMEQINDNEQPNDYAPYAIEYAFSCICSPTTKRQVNKFINSLISESDKPNYGVAVSALDERQNTIVSPLSGVSWTDTKWSDRRYDSWKNFINGNYLVKRGERY